MKSLVCVLALSCIYGAPHATGAELRVTGPAQTIFNWRRDRCETKDIPDIPARAFRDDLGQVQLIATNHFNDRRMIGTDLDHIRPKCGRFLSSHYNADPGAFDDNEWIESVYTPDGRTVYALIHDEYHGWEHEGQCSDRKFQKNCWYNAVTLAVSKNGGASFTHARAPAHLVASIPHRYDVDMDKGPAGIFMPTNIIRNPRDGYYYALVIVMKQNQDQARGPCVMRTKDLANPASWRAWDGKGFNVHFANPYADSEISPQGHLCQIVSHRELRDFAPNSVTFNTFLNHFLLIGETHVQDPGTGQMVWAISYSLSDDLLHWTEARLLMKIGPPQQFYKPGDTDLINYPSALDPRSPSRNFETTGKQFYLYYTRFNYNRPHKGDWGWDRDLVRVPLEF